VENVLGKRSFGRPRRRWRDSIKMGLREILWGSEVDGSGSASYPKTRLSISCFEFRYLLPKCLVKICHADRTVLNSLNDHFKLSGKILKHLHWYVYRNNVFRETVQVNFISFHYRKIGMLVWNSSKVVIELEQRRQYALDSFGWNGD
jgi:hypothetical protein